MSELTLKIIVLLIPGGIGAIILERLTVHKPWTSFRFILNSILIGVFSYLFLQIIVLIIYYSGVCLKIEMSSYSKDLRIWDNLNDRPGIPYFEVICSSFFGLLLGLLLTKADTKKWLNNFAKKQDLSYKYGDENLYYYFLNLEETNYVYVRYIKYNMTYLGNVVSFSEADDFKELVLSNVSVYSYDQSELLYEIAEIYLSLPKDDVIIESAQTK